MKRYLIQNVRALSRLLNSLTSGEGDTTFSAHSAWMMLHGETPRTRWWGLQRCRAINWMWRDRRHCLNAYFWHRDRDLFTRDDAL